jgi:hypothetical protein
MFTVEVPAEFLSKPEKVYLIPPGAGVDLNFTTFTVAVDVPKAVLCATAALVNAITLAGFVAVAILITEPFCHPATGAAIVNAMVPPWSVEPVIVTVPPA